MNENTGGETAELLSAMIRNACVNYGTPDSGGEARNADTLDAYLGGSGIDVEHFEPASGRRSCVYKISGTDPNAARLCLMGHTDVVPATPERWSHDPFGGEIIDGTVWGRGAVDMLNQTAAMACAMRRLADAGFRPRGDLIFLAVADEEAGGIYGAEWILEHDPNAVACDYVITEGGGFVLPDFSRYPAAQTTPTGPPAVGVMVGEKGPAALRVSFEGNPGHGSIPYGADNAVAKAVALSARLHEFVAEPQVSEIWRGLVDAMHWPDDMKQRLLDPAGLDGAIDEIAETHPQEARVFEACTHDTLSVNMVEGGTKLNVTAADAMFSVDQRRLHDEEDDFNTGVREFLGDLLEPAIVERIWTQPATESPAATALWPVLEQAADAVAGPCRLVPWTAPFTTDARFFRALGTTGYGFTLHDESVDLAEWLSRFHGDDERVSVQALANATGLYENIVRGLSQTG